MINERQNGLSIEEYSRIKNLSNIVSRHKLQTYYQEGRLCMDGSIEGTRYYLNDIINIKFE